MSVEQIRESYYQDMLKILCKHRKVNLTCMPSFGKSWIFRRYIKSFQNEKILYLTDRAHPVGEMQKYINFENPKCLAKTYQWCATRTLNILKEFITKFDTIIIDESHAIGANKAKRIIKICKEFNIKYIGGTASKIRGDARDVVIEYFDGHELEYSIRDGVNSGHLQTPEVETMLYLTLRVEKLKQKLVLHDGTEPLIELLTNREKAVAIKSSFEDSIKRAVDRVGKGLYILYHPNINAMMKAKEHIDDAFKSCFDDVQIFDITSHKDHMTIKDFESIHYGERSTGFSIIHSVQMLSTGYHPRDIKCLIFNSLTSSRVKWTQQLGRIFKFGEDHKGYIIDLVGRFQEATYDKISITPFENEEESGGVVGNGHVTLFDIETKNEVLDFVENVLNVFEDFLKGKYCMTPKMAVRSVKEAGNRIECAARACGLPVNVFQQML